VGVVEEEEVEVETAALGRVVLGDDWASSTTLLQAYGCKNRRLGARRALHHT
jgi:hypothetical protein